MSFPEVLNNLMKENGTSNVALGKAIGVSDMAVLRWRKGESSPSLDNAINIAKFYEVSLDQLAGDKLYVESNKFFLMPIIGEIRSELISYGLPSDNYMYVTNQELDGYPKSECYILQSDTMYYFVHQQKQCDPGDWIIYRKSDFISDYGIAYPVYGFGQYTKNQDCIELVDLRGKKIIYRKQEINRLVIIGVVVNQSKKVS